VKEILQQVSEQGELTISFIQNILYFEWVAYVNTPTDIGVGATYDFFYSTYLLFFILPFRERDGQSPIRGFLTTP
jgi:hypothetical protein